MTDIVVEPYNLLQRKCYTNNEPLSCKQSIQATKFTFTINSLMGEHADIDRIDIID